MLCRILTLLQSKMFDVCFFSLLPAKETFEKLPDLNVLPLLKVELPAIGVIKDSTKAKVELGNSDDHSLLPFIQNVCWWIDSRGV